MKTLSLPAVWMRGGTSKGLFFRRQDLPEDQARWSELFLAAMGSPDPYRNQLDGLGGATASTSKVAVVGPSRREDCDVDYFFAHVGIGEEVVDTSGNCGNLTAAVGPFAIHSGLVAAQSGTTRVRIWQQNTGRRIDVEVPTQDGSVIEGGHTHIDGVRGAGAGIQVDYLQPGGGEHGEVLPTGQAVDELQGTRGPYQASLIHAASPTVFVLAEDLGLQGSESRDELARMNDVLEELEALRVEAAIRMGLGEAHGNDPRRVSRERPATPKIALIGPPQDYPTPRGSWVWAEGIDLCARIISMGRPLQAFTGTGAIALAVAAQIPGSLVNGVARPRSQELALGHAAGLMRVRASLHEDPRHGWIADSAGMLRTARRLMVGRVFLPDGVERSMD